MSKDTTYNGWKNYETWNVALWLDNDQGSQDDMIRAAEDHRDDPHGLADYIRDYIEEFNPLADQASVFSDLLNAALSEVDWYEIAEHYIADLEPIETEEEESEEEPELEFDGDWVDLIGGGSVWLDNADFDYVCCGDTNVYSHE